MEADRSGLEWGAERGLFFDAELDRAGGRAGSTWRKNTDFLRLKDAALYLIDPQQGRVIVDIGCANGANMVYCGLQGAIVFGQDLDAMRVEQANDKLRRLGISGEARVGDARALPFEASSVDAVLSSDFHEHLNSEDQVRVLREAFRVLKAGGVLVVKTPNLAYLQASLSFKRVRALLRGRDPRAFRIPHTPGTEDPEHIGLSTRIRLDRQLATAGFQSWTWHYPPLRRFGVSTAVDILTSELPVIRDLVCEDLLVCARKPIAVTHFPD